MSIATHRLSSELNREGELCQTTSKVAWATAKYSSRRCQSYGNSPGVNWRLTIWNSSRDLGNGKWMGARSRPARRPTGS